jgi:hypothetical protein
LKTCSTLSVSNAREIEEFQIDGVVIYTLTKGSGSTLRANKNATNEQNMRS